MTGFASRFAFASTKLRRALAVTSVVLATGGLVLYRAPASAYPGGTFGRTTLSADGKNAAAFAGPGVHGVLSLSHTKILAGQSNTVFAEILLSADPAESRFARVHAPISLAVVLDTSGSMSGEKIEDAKRSVLRLLSDMHDEDEIAVVRYSDRSEILQPLARVGTIRESLSARIRTLTADGGTNIPGGLSHGLRALEQARSGRVRRIVLVSDGLDGTRSQAETIAHDSFASGITVSSLGIGLDFDESYMGSVAQSGHGNFAFVKDSSALASFLKRELDETQSTTVENARVHLHLPSGMQLVSAIGADVSRSGGDVELAMGSLFAGDSRRVIVELQTIDGAESLAIESSASWSLVGSGAMTAAVPRLALTASLDPAEVERGRDGAVFASATSAISSKRQVEAANAYAKGDIARSTALAAQNAADLEAAIAAAPAPVATALRAQANEYREQKKTFTTVRPQSAQGNAAAKSAATREMDNMNRKIW